MRVQPNAIFAMLMNTILLLPANVFPVWPFLTAFIALPQQPVHSANLLTS